MVQATVTEINDATVKLDRAVKIGDSLVQEVPFSFLILATGTKLAAPSTLPVSDKVSGVEYLRNHAQTIAKSSRIAVLGGGAVGVQMALDIKEIYPGKTVLLVHSRDRLMHNFHPNLDRIIQQRCAELGVQLIMNSRVVIPAKGFPLDGRSFQIDLQNGGHILADFAVSHTLLLLLDGKY